MKGLALAVAGAVACASVFFLPVIFSDKTFIARDHYLFYNPRLFFAAETLRGGDLPLWNPYSACGVPCQASIQNAVFYPLSFLYYLLPFQTGYKYYVIVHYVLAALFMYLLLRAWQAPESSAFMAGLVFAFGGYLASINDNVAFLASAAWTPLVLLCCHRLIEKKSLLQGIKTAAVISMQILAGDASFYLVSSFFITIIYAIAACLRPQPQVKTGGTVKTLASVCAAWAAGVLLVSVQLVPFFEFVLQSHRAGGLSFTQATKWSYHPLELVQLLVPYCFGSIVPGLRWFGQLWLDTMYISIFALGCAVLFLLASQHHLKLFLIIVLGTGLFLGTGHYNPCYVYLFRWVPGFALMQYPVKFLFLVHLALSIMAGLGFQTLCTLRQRQAVARTFFRVLAGSLVLFVLLLVLVFVSGDACYRLFLEKYPHTDYFLPVAQQVYSGLWRAIIILIVLVFVFFATALALYRQLLSRNVAVCLCCSILFVDLLAFGKPHDPSVSQRLLAEPTATGRFLKQDPTLFRIYSLAAAQSRRSFLHVYYLPFEKVYRIIRETQQANTNIYEHLPSAEEYTDLLLTRYYDLFSVVERCITEQRFDPAIVRMCSALFSLLNVKYIISPFPLDAFPFTLVRDGQVKIYKNEAVLPRAFLFSQVAVCPDDDEVLSRLLRSEFNPTHEVYLTAAEASKIPRNLLSDLSASPSVAGAGSVSVATYQPNAVGLIASVHRPVLLMLADTYYPGWKAFDNGREVPLLRVNHTLRGVILEPGEHDILFVFKPSSLVLGAWLSLAAAGACLLCLIVKRKRSDRYKKPLSMQTP